MWFAKTSHTTRQKCCACHAKWRWRSPKCCAPATKNATHRLKTSQKYCACNTKGLWTRYETCWNVTKCHACHACHAKRSYATFESSKSDNFYRTRHRHGHTGLARTVANGCGRKRNVERTHPQPPDPQSETGSLAMPTLSGKTWCHAVFGGWKPTSPVDMPRTQHLGDIFATDNDFVAWPHLFLSPMYLYRMSLRSFMECSFECHFLNPDFRNIGPAGTSKLLNLPSSFATHEHIPLKAKCSNNWKLNGS